MRFLGFLFFMFSLLNAEVFVEIQKVQISKIETQAIGNYEIVYYAYGNIYRRLVYDNGKSVRLPSLHNVFIGELKEMRTLEKIGWHYVGFPNEEMYHQFKWGRAYNLNGREYVPYQGVRKGYRHSQQDNSYSSYNDYGDDYSYETEEYEDNSYEDNNYHENTSLNNYSQPQHHNRQYSETADEWLDEGITEQSLPNYNRTDNFIRDMRELVYLLSQESSFASRVELYAKSFPDMTKHQKGLSGKIDRALDGLPASTKVMFYGTATQYCIRKGIHRGFDYYLSRLHKLTSDEVLLSDVQVYSEGSRYSGELKNSIRHGYGILLRPDGSKYYGQWRDGLKNGVGLQQSSDNSFYVGDWKNNKRHGYGTLVLGDGEVYQQGWWRDGHFTGEVYYEEQIVPQDDFYSEDGFVEEDF